VKAVFKSYNIDQFPFNVTTAHFYFREAYVCKIIVITLYNIVISFALELSMQCSVESFAILVHSYVISLLCLSERAYEDFKVDQHYLAVNTCLVSRKHNYYSHQIKLLIFMIKNQHICLFINYCIFKG
jgi:hypothetical protein